MILIAVLGVGATVLTGRSPLLGLDLKGGVSVVEQPQGKVTPSILQEAVQVIDRRVDGIGVSNSNVTRQGNDIVIELPGAKNDTQVLKIVGQTAQLFFRPVDCIIAPYIAPTTSTTTKTPTATTTTSPGQAKLKPKSTTTTAKAKSAAGGGGVINLTASGARLATARFPIAAGTSTTAKSTGTTGKSTTTVAPVTSTTAAKGATTTTTTASTTTTTSLGSAICNLSSTEQELYLPPHGNSHGVTPASDDNGDATVVLPDYAGYAYGRYVLAPEEMTGSIIKTAAANLNSQTDQWEVDISFTGKGSSQFNKYAATHYQCYVEDESNPPYCALQAIELDATVESDPAIEAASFNGGATINGSTSDPFTATQAQDLALALSYGSLPVRFVAQDISNVSPQIGTASLDAGAIAGRVPGAYLPDHLLPRPGPGGGDRHMHVGRLHLRHNHLAQRH